MNTMKTIDGVLAQDVLRYAELALGIATLGPVASEQNASKQEEMTAIQARTGLNHNQLLELAAQRLISSD